ncbi:PIN domain-containing protein [Acidovorax sp. LjRoot129]|uniref:PIN domain-containing protein n=1 Tax=Acidovorax sp. LjRoot129 TaxID=3342260 RepID=UPI003ECDCB91
MAVLSIDELKQSVVAGRVGAISIDTSVVERHQYGFESGVLAKMSQFSRAETKHLALDIVLHEMRAHLTKEADLVRSQVTNALKPLGNSWGIDKDRRVEALRILFGAQSGDARTQERLQAFLDDSAATVVTCAEFVGLQDVLSRFVETKPPFGNKEAKKYEFPDAIALLALEGWAIKNDTTVVAVSSDGDWKRFCLESDHVHYVDDLAHALSVFQASGDDAAALFKAMLRDGKIEDLDAILLDAVDTQSDKIDIDFEAASNWYYEAEVDNVKVTSVTPLTDQIKAFDVVEYEDKTLVLQTSLTIDVTAHFSASFQLWDSIDREYSSMGSTTVSQTEALELDLIITVLFDNGSATIDSVELLPASTTMDFGEIGPDWLRHSGDEEEPE